MGEKAYYMQHGSPIPNTDFLPADARTLCAGRDIYWATEMCDDGQEDDDDEVDEDDDEDDDEVDVAETSAVGKCNEVEDEEEEKKVNIADVEVEDDDFDVDDI